MKKRFRRLNPFVQVFYSNAENTLTGQKQLNWVLIPLFRSFILILSTYRIIRRLFRRVLIPLFRSFILIGYCCRG